MAPKRNLRALLTLIASCIAVAALLQIAAEHTEATHVPLDAVAIDTITVGNSATAVGAVDACSTIQSIGSTLQLDLIVKGVPPYNANAFTDGIGGFGANLLHDPNIIRITPYNYAFLLNAGGAPQPVVTNLRLP